MTLATWAQARDPQVERAKAQLATMPISLTGRGAQVPWPWFDRKLIKAKFKNKEINRAITNAPIKEVDLDELHSIQHSVKPPHVLWYLDHPDAREEGHLNPKTNTPDDYPIVLQFDGKLIVWDGNHRLTALTLLRRSSADVRLVDLERAL
jgi:hypothetical protein